MKKPVGWRNEPYRHSLAAHGVKTLPYPNKMSADRMGEIEHVLVSDLVTFDPHLRDMYNERGMKITGEAAIKLQMVKTNYWDDDFEKIHRLLSRALNAPRLSESYTSRWIQRRIDEGTLNEGIISLVDNAHPEFADLSKTVILHDYGGMLEGVYNLPKGWKYEYFDIPEGNEDDFERLPKLRSKTVRIVYYGALPETVEGLPKGYNYQTYFDNY